MFIDGDLDGRADLFVVNGMVTGKNPREREIEFWNLMSSEYKKFEKGIATADFGEDSLWGRPPKRFYRNLDGRRFAELAAVTGLESDANQRGLVVLDADSDGAPDLFATGFLSKPALWVNRNPSRARTLAVTLQGLPSAKTRYRTTRDALGAEVTVEAGGSAAHSGRLGRLLVPFLRLQDSLLRSGRPRERRSRHDPMAVRQDLGALQRGSGKILPLRAGGREEPPGSAVIPFGPGI